VYFMLKGDKGKYEGSKARYNFMFIVFGVIFYSTVQKAFFAASVTYGVMLIIGLISMAITLHKKWKTHDRLPHPFQSAPVGPNPVRSRALESHSFESDGVCTRCGRVRHAVEHFSIFCTESSKEDKEQEIAG